MVAQTRVRWYLYKGRKNDEVPPPVATWRSNLAASSQRRNLLFAAYGRDIYVWIPRGPFQKLGSKAEMIIQPVMENANASGYIDQATPHTINNILVDDLGRDEILLLATDSGNICAYHVEAIYSAINRCSKGGYQRPYDGAEITPFFVENVGMSAWGLATHKFARLIAVSANTGQITVFAFALVDAASTDSDESQTSNAPSITQSDQTWVYIDSRKHLRELKKLMPQNHRSRNLRITYRGHFDNIPCVSFANFDLDPNGMWMVSTDISNRVIVWRIWDDLWPARLYYPGHPMNNPPQRGWTVLPLDPRTFKHHISREDACGCAPEPMIVEQRLVLDVSKAIEDVPDASQLFVFGYPKERVTPRGRVISNGVLPDDIFSPDCCISSECEPRVATSPGQQVPSKISNQDHVDGESVPSSETGGHISETDSADEGDNVDSGRLIRTKPFMRSLFEEDNEHYQVISRLHHEYSFEMQSDTSFDIIKRRLVHPRSPAFFPVIHFSEHNISLAPYPMDSEYEILCKNSLFQRFAFNQDIHSACDRFNMVKYIPELGLVVAASQKGRVAIIALTWQEEIGYAFRLDWIVPFWSQERDNCRPMLPLLGLAVSPMPGFEISPDIPCIPRGVDPNDWVNFNYRILNPDDEEEQSSPSSPTSSTQAQRPRNHRVSGYRPEDSTSSEIEAHYDSELDQGSSPGDPQSGLKSQGNHHQYTPAELHAQASSAYRPHEHWHGWHPSRHYRLLLLYCDHTVMSYEFWHDWKP
ncbi:uncharacterized protein N7459_009623 [Penicillium hispanicum]|uniref:uncharacterized protein n=1 Tax=Penicillium hispanicum TaxID=1080232 RepID=UPI00253FE0A0|nr:uncharacterized protein N7459_009623 [Penicillium hispanicum]KAJ5570193.1 hypothetical protein N7459_009623 [Penicillium hispanicum]